MIFNTRKCGFDAEKVACQFLLKQQLQLIEKNFYCRYGEIDLIMLDNNDLVFIEVRHRKKQSFMHTIESIDKHKQKKIVTTSQYFLQTNKRMRNYDLRFDVILINDDINNHKIEWLKNAFQV